MQDFLRHDYRVLSWTYLALLWKCLKNFKKLHFKKLQHTATHCNTLLQHTATHRVASNVQDVARNPATFCTLGATRCVCNIATQSNTLQHTSATLCDTLQHTAAHCNTLQHTATHCNTLPHAARHCNTHYTHCNTLQHTATRCNTLHHTATHCNTLQRS